MEVLQKDNMSFKISTLAKDLYEKIIDSQVWAPNNTSSKFESRVDRAPNIEQNQQNTHKQQMKHDNQNEQIQQKQPRKNQVNKQNK